MTTFPQTIQLLQSISNIQDNIVLPVQYGAISAAGELLC